MHPFGNIRLDPTPEDDMAADRFGDLLLADHFVIADEASASRDRSTREVHQGSAPERARIDLGPRQAHTRVTPDRPQILCACPRLGRSP